ncbi:MAG: hypothetical protein K2Q22_16440 [Cytophagales bacterium]|nr:hypothetical protein [Cytophagales bacterium]
MTDPANYILQFVGFQTPLAPEEFIQRWMPFAKNFKAQGILDIDLYLVENKGIVNYISKNLWEEKKYLHYFPSGIAGAGSGGGISVTQFGGYRILADHLERFNQMKLLFLPNPAEISQANIISCPSITEKVPFKQVLILGDHVKFEWASDYTELQCKHLKQI